MNGLNQITCPQCLAHLSEVMEVCPACGLTLPSDYCRICSEAPPLPIVAIGFTHHGKSHSLATCLLAIDELTTLLPNVSYRPLGEHTSKSLGLWRSAERARRKLAPTPPIRPDQLGSNVPAQGAIEPSREPLIFSVSGFYAPRTLLIYDMPGQSFETYQKGHLTLPALRLAQTVWFVVSGYDLENPRDGMNDESKLLADLFGTYSQAMKSLGASLEGRNAVIVLTKGDKLGATRATAKVGGTDWIKEYLDTDPCAPDYRGIETFSPEAYDQPLHDMSDRLEKFCARLPTAQNLINLLREHKMNVHFCVTASLGADASEEHDTKVPGGWKRQRSLDPLIWTLTLEKERVEANSLHLILDGGADAEPAYASHGGAPLPEALWQVLTRQREVSVWLLGQSGPAAAPRMPPPSAPPARPRPRLIGPLLESLPAGARAVAVTHGVIPDLQDFRGTEWNGRLLLVCTSDQEAVMNQWDRPHTVVFRSEADLDHIASLAQSLA